MSRAYTTILDIVVSDSISNTFDECTTGVTASVINHEICTTAMDKRHVLLEKVPVIVVHQSDHH